MKSPEEYTDEPPPSSEKTVQGGAFGVETFQDGMPDQGFNAPILQGEMPGAVSNRVLLLGEQNPYGGDPSFALYPAPDGCSGHRLCCRILGLSRREYLERFDRRNVLEGFGTWSARAARTAASRILGDHRRVVALGAKVAAALGLPTEPFRTHDLLLHGAEERYILVLPHPSGLSRAWNAPGAFERARKMVFDLEARK